MRLTEPEQIEIYMRGVLQGVELGANLDADQLSWSLHEKKCKLVQDMESKRGQMLTGLKMGAEVKI